ncbi:hypothetical protein [Croceicoccus naphthovorans]|uniref:Uncharacterized protein n=1 Tax=Croceicoccus naphthovorans TaxID=1348774 RepID=A0A0G3XG40_9SPHN|nr:hypothetical protein [Croceicoccus naphthovorans]AKM10152.1 hypothetical protein AB433_09490 [Croceicoccus naphthovorans]MBB3990620.1 hypothetical protein [Croceicoccus naphthovorans]
MPSIAGLNRPARAIRSVFRDADSAFWPLAGIAILLIAQATIIVTRAINWDEFIHYGILIDMVSGQRVSALQTLWQRVFAWLPTMPGDTIDRIRYGRAGMLAFELLTLTMIAAIARRFTDHSGAAMGALAWLSAGYVLQHGFSFRADPVVTATLTTALAVLAWRKLDAITALIVGALLGVAGMLTIKAVLYAAAFAGLACLRWTEAERKASATLTLLAIPILAALTFALIHELHASAIAGQVRGASAITSASSTALADNAWHYVFFIGRPNNLGFVVGAISTGLGLFAMILAFPFALKGRSLHQRIALIGMIAIVATPAFYENTAPYYYTFMLAPVAIACVVSIDLARRKVPAMVISALLMSLAISVFAHENRKIISHQKRIDAVATSLFDERVAYFDHADALPGFDKMNPFMSPWGIRGYLANGRPIYSTAMRQRPVPLLLANWHPFISVFAGEEKYFLPEDAKAIRENYVQFEGPVWLAGKTVPAHGSNNSEVLVPGPYTLRGGALTIDGVVRKEGDVLNLDRGHHMLVNSGGSAASIVYGNRLEAVDSLNFSGTWIDF